MLYLFKPLPANDRDFSNWKPFIKNVWFQRHFMKFVYSLQIILIIISMMLGVWNFANGIIKGSVFILVFIVYELIVSSFLCKHLRFPVSC